MAAQASDGKMRASLEQRRAALLQAQADTARGERERKLAKRYHKVKFFGACPLSAHVRRLRLGRLFAGSAQAARRPAAERKKIMKAQVKLRAEVEAQGWVRRCGRSACSATLGGGC